MKLDFSVDESNPENGLPIHRCDIMYNWVNDTYIIKLYGDKEHTDIFWIAFVDILNIYLSTLDFKKGTKT